MLAKRAPERNRPRWLIRRRGELAFHTAARLQAAGCGCLFVRPGEIFEEQAPGHYVLPPARGEDYGALLQTVLADGAVCAGIVHLWSADGPGTDTRPRTSLLKEWIRLNKSGAAAS